MSTENESGVAKDKTISLNDLKIIMNKIKEVTTPSKGNNSDKGANTTISIDDFDDIMSKMRNLSTTQSTNNTSVQGSDTISPSELDVIMSEIEKMKTGMTSNNSANGVESVSTKVFTPLLSRIEKLHDSGSNSEGKLEPKKLFPSSPEVEEINKYIRNAEENQRQREEKEKSKPTINDVLSSTNPEEESKSSVATYPNETRFSQNNEKAAQNIERMLGLQTVNPAQTDNKNAGNISSSSPNQNLRENQPNESNPNPNNLQKDSKEYEECMKNLEVFKGKYFNHMRNKEGSELTEKECKTILTFILNQFYIYPKLHPDDKRVKIIDDSKKMLHIILHFFQDEKATEKFRKKCFILLQSSRNGRTGELGILLGDALSNIGNNLFIGTKFGRQFIEECKINQDDIELPKLKLKSYSLLPQHYQDFDENMNFPLNKGTNIKSLSNLTQSAKEASS